MPRHPELQAVTPTQAIPVVGESSHRAVCHRTDDPECGHDDHE